MGKTRAEAQRRKCSGTQEKEAHQKLYEICFKKICPGGSTKNDEFTIVIRVEHVAEKHFFFAKQDTSGIVDLLLLLLLWTKQSTRVLTFGVC